MNKYGAKKTTIDGITFDSKAEAGRYCELKILEKAGHIKNLKLQPKYEIIPKFGKNKPTYYIADFQYNEGNKIVVEDVKGVRTEVYRIKKKLFMINYPDADFREVI